MSKTKNEILRSLAWPTYFVALSMVAIPALDYLSNVWPIEIGNVQWRYGAVGLFAGFMLTPLFGVLFAIGAATILEHRLVLRILSILNFTSGVLLLGLVLLFALDVVQLRGSVPTEAQSVFDVGAAKAVVKYLMMVMALAWLGLVGFRVTQVSKGAKSEDAKVPLVRP